MKKIVLVLMVTLMGTMMMNAQPPHRHDMTPEQRVEKRIEQLNKALSLTEKQKTEITRIFMQEMEEMHKDKPAVKEQGKKPDEAAMQAHREKMKAQRDATNAKIEALLTPEQAAKFAQMKQREGRRGHEKARKGPQQDRNRGDQRHDCCKGSCKDK